MNPAAPRSLPRDAGFTLVELLVAMIIGVMLTGAVIAILVGGTSAYNIQLGHARVFENARFALEYLDRDLRMAGYLGCLPFGQPIHNNLRYQPGSLYDVSRRIEGYDGERSLWLPSGWSARGLDIVDGSDAITLRFANPTRAATIDERVEPADAIRIESPDPDFHPGEVVVVSDCDKGDVLQITGANDDALDHDRGDGVSPGNESSLLGGAAANGYDRGARVMSLIAVRYFVGRSDRGTGLYRQYLSREAGAPTTQELVEGVESLRLLFGEDTDGSGRVDRFVTAVDVENWRRIIAVKAALVIRSAEEYGARKESSPERFELFGEPFVDDAALRVRRHVFSTTVLLRNAR